jgi:hypothetical protein
MPLIPGYPGARLGNCLSVRWVTHQCAFACPATSLPAGGANRSDHPRLIVTPQYCVGWVRQLENMCLAVPPEIADKLPERVRELIGYSKTGWWGGDPEEKPPSSVIDVSQGPDGEWSVLVREAVGVVSVDW